jgi:hypothetical protein
MRGCYCGARPKLSIAILSAFRRCNSKRSYLLDIIVKQGIAEFQLSFPAPHVVAIKNFGQVLE